MVKIVQIDPKDLFHFQWFLLCFCISILFIILSLLFIIVYMSQRHSVTDASGKKIHIYPPPTLLYLAVSLSFVSLVLNLVLFFYYLKIFQVKGSTTFYCLVAMVVLNLLVIVFAFYFLFAQDCPRGQKYSTKLTRCVPQCAPGSLLDEESFTCIQGCQDSSDCPDNQTCTLGECCDLNTHTVINNQCCPNASVHCLTDSSDSCPVDQLYCCSSNVVCKDKQGNRTICCLDPDATCQDSPNGGQFCAVKCGNSYCTQNQLCLETDVLNGTTTRSCEAVDTSKCQRSKTSNPIYYPSALDNFYPAYNYNTDDSTKLGDVLNCNPFTDSSACQTAINDAFNPKDPSQHNEYGWICGASSPVNFEYHKYQGTQDTCPKQFLIQTQAIAGVTDRADIQYDGNDTYINIRNNRHENTANANDDESSSKPITSVKTTQPYHVSSSVMDSSPSHLFLLGSNPKPTPSLSSQGNDTQPCTKSNIYRQSCNNFFEKCLPSNQCPFDSSKEAEAQCKYENGSGVINKNEVVTASCVKYGDYTCRQYDNDKFTPCSKQTNCPSLGVNTQDSIFAKSVKFTLPCFAQDTANCNYNLGDEVNKLYCPVGNVQVLTMRNGKENNDNCRRSRTLCNYKTSGGHSCKGCTASGGQCGGSGDKGNSGCIWMGYLDVQCCNPDCLREKFGDDIDKLTGKPCFNEVDQERDDNIRFCCGDPTTYGLDLGSNMGCHNTDDCDSCAAKGDSITSAHINLTNINRQNINAH